MPKEDLTKLTEHFAAARGVRPRGDAWLPIQQGMRAMVAKEGYAVEQVIGCMDQCAANGWTWTIATVRRWIADYAAGTMPSGNGDRTSRLSIGQVTSGRDVAAYEALVTWPQDYRAREEANDER